MGWTFKDPRCVVALMILRQGCSVCYGVCLWGGLEKHNLGCIIPCATERVLSTFTAVACTLRSCAPIFAVHGSYGAYDIIAASDLDVACDLFLPVQGPVFATAIVAGVMAVKKTSELIPFCHPLPIEKCDVRVSVLASAHVCRAPRWWWLLVSVAL